MTSTLSPYDTGDIRLGEGTRDLTYLTQRPALRRPDATGEFPLYQPKTIGDVDQMARLALEATLVHEIPLPPIDSLPDAVRWPAPTTHRAKEDGPAREDDGRLAEEEPVTLAAVMPQPDKRPRGYRGRYRAAVSPWLSAVLTFSGGAVGGVTVLVVAVFLAGGPR